MMDLQRLRFLSELRGRGTIAAVAAALSYSPSTVSHQLAELQRELGVTLFERDGRRLRLTEAAHVLARHADALLERVERAEAEVAAAAGAITGVVRIAAFQTAAISLVAPVLGELSARHPGLRVETELAEPHGALDALERRTCDLALCDEYASAPRPRPAGLRFEELQVETVRLVVPAGHPASAAGPVPLAALETAVWTGGEPDSSHGRMVAQVCRSMGGFTPDIRHRTSDLLALLAYVGAGQAVTLVPELARPERDPAVSVLEIAGGPILRRIFTVVREGSLARPALTAVTTALHAVATRTPPRHPPRDLARGTCGVVMAGMRSVRGSGGPGGLNVAGMAPTIGLFAANMYAAAGRDGATRIAGLAERLGYDSLWVGDHVVLPRPRVDPSPMDPDDPLLDPLVALGFLAARTERILLGSGIVILPQRNPLVLAKQVASVDVVSGGRLIFGLGAGYLEPEMRAIGVPMAGRGERTEEYLRAMREIWESPQPAFHGRFVEFEKIDAYPRPIQRPLPVVVGGHSPAAHRRAVTYGDGWFGFMLGLRATAAQLDSLRVAAEGRDRPLHISVSPARRLDPEAVRAYAELGVHRLVVVPPPGLPLDELEGFVERHAPERLEARPAW